MIQSTAERMQMAMPTGSGTVPRPRIAGEGTASRESSDAVELSPVARRTAESAAPIRGELVSRVRAEIENGTYLTEDKLDAVVNRLHRELFQD